MTEMENTESDSDRPCIPKHVEDVEACRDLLVRALSRKHHHLTHDEYIKLRHIYRKTHWSQDARPSGFFGLWYYSSKINESVAPKLDEYLRTHGIVVLPPVLPESLHPYQSGEAIGLARLDVVERKATLARKLQEQRQRMGLNQL